MVAGELLGGPSIARCRQHGGEIGRRDDSLHEFKRHLPHEVRARRARVEIVNDDEVETALEGTRVRGDVGPPLEARAVAGGWAHLGDLDEPHEPYVLRPPVLKDLEFA